MTVLADEESRCILALDVPGFSSPVLSDPERVSLRDHMYSSLTGAIGDADIRLDSCRIEDRGDGALILLPADVGADEAWRLVRSHLVRRVSRTASLRLRVALHRGPVHQTGYGMFGESLNLLFRLLEARPLRRAMADPDYNFGVIVSAAIHEELSTAVDGLEPVRVQIRDTTTLAWISTVATAPVSPPILDITASVRESATFVGRARALARLDDLLATDDASPGLVTITGPPGIGKTALALRWIEMNYARFGGFSVIDDDGATSGALVDEFINGVPQAGRLLLFDDVARPRAWTRTLAGLNAAGVSVILTTRSAPAGIGAHIDLGPLERDDAVALLREVIDDPRTDWEPAAITGLADLLGGHPLALSLAGARLAAWPGDSVTDLLDRLREVGEHTLREVFAYTYEGLDDDLKRAFRLTSVFPSGFDLTVAMTAALNDVDQQEAGQFLEDLSRANLVTSTDGERYRPHFLLLDFAGERCAEEDTDEDREAARARLATAIRREHMPEGVILRDHWTLRDDLSYTAFVEAIAAFLGSAQTRPPLTIGIKGAWGSGKTSLMRMLRRRLDRGGQIHLPGHTHRVSIRDLLRGDDEPVHPADVPYRITVWFNPWMYQRTDQVWAGLAHEIITQVTERLPAVDRERFWLRLNRTRVDHEAIRRRCYRLLFSRLLPRAAVWLAVLLVLGWVGAAVVTAFAATRVSGAVADLLPELPALAVVLAAGADLAGRVRAFWRGPAPGSLTRLVQAPDAAPPPADPIWSDPAYRTRTGYLHAVYEDVRHVLDLVASEQHPLVVFVDDLDRCDSRTVAEVIEALNVFLAGEFPNCVFVIAMEPGAVAAHIEAANPELVTAHRDGRLPGDWPSLGWRFLDKIVQLPLTLPNPRPEHVRTYVEALLRHGADDPFDEVPAPVRGRASVDAAMAAIRERATSPEDLYDAARAAQADLVPRPGDGSPSGWPPDTSSVILESYTNASLRDPQARHSPTERDPAGEPEPPAPDEVAAGSPLNSAVQEAAMRVFAEMYDDAAAQQAVTEALPVLGSHNPREIKRFVNLFRFYSYIRLANQLSGQPVPDPPQLAKLTALVIRWPQLLSVLGTPDGDAPHPLTTLERAAARDDDAWWEAVGTHLAYRADGDQPASWASDLRVFLARPPAIGVAAGML